METFVDIISDIGAQISKIKRYRINQQTLDTGADERCLSICIIISILISLLLSYKICIIYTFYLYSTYFK